MGNEKGMSVVNNVTGEIIETHPTPLMVTPQAIQQTRQSIALLQGLVKDILVRGRDFGTVPGIPGDFLWDPGASIIISSYNCRPGERRMIHFVNTENEVSVVVEVPLVSLVTGTVVGTGIGAASTHETKYGKLWVDNPLEWGYNEESMKTLKTRQRNGEIQFHIPRPERGELVNTLVKMASKRAEVDAAGTLPGVSSALRELFDSKGKRPERSQPDWKGFYAQLSKRGISEQEGHELLGVTSYKQWLDQGHTLEEGIQVMDKKRSTNGSVHPPQGPKRDPKSITSLTELYNACHDDFKVSDGKGNMVPMQPADVVKELGYNSQMDIGEPPAEAYAKIASTRM